MECNTETSTHIKQNAWAQFRAPNFSPINSDSFIQGYQLEKRKKYRIVLSEKKQLDNEIRKTNQNLKVKRLSRDVNLISSTLGNFTASPTNLDTGEINPSKTFDEFMARTKIDQVRLKSKMKLFSNAISERSKATIEREINSELMKIEDRKIMTIATNSPNFGATSPQLRKFSCAIDKENFENEKKQELKQFTTCYMILEKFLALVAENPKYIVLKHQHPAIYQSLKKKMLEILIENEHITNSAQFLNEKMKLSSKEQFQFSKAKMKKLQKGRKPFYLLKEQKKDGFTEQITEIFESLEAMVEQSLNEFTKNKKFNETKLNWKKKENEFHFEKQSFLRKTTFEKFNFGVKEF